jgi:hypothetical protein
VPCKEPVRPGLLAERSRDLKTNRSFTYTS